MIRLFWAGWLLLISAPLARANGYFIEWPGWTITTTEQVDGGLKYQTNNVTPRYPTSLMFDDEPATAWVYSATGREWDTSISDHAIAIKMEPDEPVEIDRIRIMNGQNQSSMRFHRNDRLSKVRITMQTSAGKHQFTATLIDAMGWHDIHLGRYKIQAITLEVLEVKRGEGPRNDVCISEIELYDGAHKINMHMPHAVIYYDGTEGCGDMSLLSREGRMMAGVAYAAGCVPSWSPTGRYVAAQTGEKFQLWIADAWRGQMVKDIHHLKVESRDKKWLSDTLAGKGLTQGDS